MQADFDAAREARALDMYNLGGAPNVLRGGSLSGNLDITAALREGLIDALSSDYYPASMLHAAIRLWKDGVMELHQSIARVTEAPARIVGCAREVGALRVGLQADLLMVDLDGDVPRVLMTWVGGRCVSRAGAAHAAACARSIRRRLPADPGTRYSGRLVPGSAVRYLRSWYLRPVSRRGSRRPGR